MSPGTKIDRYGYPSGYYASPVGTPAEMRALVPGSLEKPYTVYEVIKPVDTLSGQAMPWFGQPGLGTQYKFTQSIENMLKQDIIKEVGK
ncbi:TNT domain-containing protein [Desulfitobacterium dehalogenans]|uniref:TNT domain-containing protein n=1 Tax=Desulfitobacterium TaxID=36853 RepID=UPI0013050FB0|nr:TNT domain-containing protein [Desulfitobacterium dehalogenans]